MSRKLTKTIIIGALIFTSSFTNNLVANPIISEGVLKKAQELRDKALQSSDAFSHAESLTVEVGPRLVGSAGDDLAVAWAIKRLKAIGADSVRTEPVNFPYWERGVAEAEILSPFPQSLVVSALGGSVGTPAEGVKGNVVLFESLEELKSSNPDQVKNKIVFINKSTIRHIEGKGYGATVGQRSKGAVEAARKGAKALLIRSVGTSHNRLAHTGSMRYSDSVERIPAAALSIPDANLIVSMLARGKPVSVGLNMSARNLGVKTTYNVIADIRGREKPEEIVLIGAHLDSWDEGTGALDDGAGVAIVLEAARFIAELPERPRRTIRVVLFAAEEIGLIGSKHYLEAHSSTLENHIVALESDFGADKVWRFDTRFDSSKLGIADQIMQVLSPLGISRGSNNTRGGPDVMLLAAKGVPVVALYQDGTDYFDFHHSPNDTLDKIDAENLKQNVAAWVSFSYLVAEMEGYFKGK